MENYQTSINLEARGLRFEAVPAVRARGGATRGYTARLFRGDVYVQWYQSDAVLTPEYLREYERMLVRTSKTSGRVLGYE